MFKYVVIRNQLYPINTVAEKKKAKEALVWSGDKHATIFEAPDATEESIEKLSVRTDQRLFSLK